MNQGNNYSVLNNKNKLSKYMAEARETGNWIYSS
jgi:hypothetical protein